MPGRAKLFFLILFLNKLRLAHNIVNSNQAKPSRAKIKDSKFSEQSFLSFQLLWIESLFAPKSSFFASKFFPVILPQYCIFFSYNGAILVKFCHGIMLFLCPIYDPIPGTYFSPISHLSKLLTFEVDNFLAIMSCHNVVFTQLIV